MLVNTCPGVLPRLIAQIVEDQLVLDLSLGHHKSLENLVSVLDRFLSFSNPALYESRDKTSSLISEGLKRRLWRTNDSHDEMDLMLAEVAKPGAGGFTMERMQYFIYKGDFGWAAKLPTAEHRSLIEVAKQFYAENFPAMCETVRDNPDSEQDLG